MKKRFLKAAHVLGFAAAATLAVQAESPEKSAPKAEQSKVAVTNKPVPRSIFGVPTKLGDGRDPFYPASDRLFAVKTAPRHAPVASGATLLFNGISGTPEHRLAMINGYTFAEGEEASVNTASGRVVVRCLEIKGEMVVVEVAGERRELHFQNR